MHEKCKIAYRLHHRRVEDRKYALDYSAGNHLKVLYQRERHGYSHWTDFWKKAPVQGCRLSSIDNALDGYCRPLRL